MEKNKESCVEISITWIHGKPLPEASQRGSPKVMSKAKYLTAAPAKGDVSTCSCVPAWPVALNQEERLASIPGVAFPVNHVLLACLWALSILWDLCVTVDGWILSLLHPGSRMLDLALHGLPLREGGQKDIGDKLSRCFSFILLAFLSLSHRKQAPSRCQSPNLETQEALTKSQLTSWS